MWRAERIRLKLLFLVAAGALSLVLLTIGGYQLIEFSDSAAFCGKVCHQVMYPEYTTFNESPHSRVTCAGCHVGSGVDYFLRAKVSGIPMIFQTITGTHERPITSPVKDLRPARDTCEQCHRPETFTGDKLRSLVSYARDEKNTAREQTLVLRVGGGGPGAKDIHWHISARLWYLPLDEKRQQIGWVGLEGAGGRIVTEYIDKDRATEVNASRLARDKRLMDCIDCHNRATHVFRSPEELVDTAMTKGLIDKSLPFVKREAVKVFEPAAANREETDTRAENIINFYRDNYPQIYTEKAESLGSLVTELREIVRLTFFPEMRVDWKTHVNNIGHQEWPGCFRCHGKLEKTSAGGLINATCDTCHFNVSVVAQAAPQNGMPHPVKGFEDCLSCHGPQGVKPVPADHTGRTNNTCTLCHQP